MVAREIDGSEEVNQSTREENARRKMARAQKGTNENGEITILRGTTISSRVPSKDIFLYSDTQIVPSAQV